MASRTAVSRRRRTGPGEIHGVSDRRATGVGGLLARVRRAAAGDEHDAPATATAVPPMPSAMAAMFAFFPSVSTADRTSWSRIGHRRRASAGRPSAWRGTPRRRRRRRRSAPAPISDQPTTARACDGSPADRRLRRRRPAAAAAARAAAVSPRRSAATSVGGGGDGGATAAAAFRRSSAIFSWSAILRSTSSRLRAFGIRWRKRR